MSIEAASLPLNVTTIDGLVAYAMDAHDLDPRIRELADLRRQPIYGSHKRKTLKSMYNHLNPNYGVHCTETGTIVLTVAGLLNPETVLFHHIPNLDDQMRRIVVDCDGTHIWGIEDHQDHLATVEYIDLAPTAFDRKIDYEEICELIASLIDMSLEANDLTGLRIIEIVRVEDINGHHWRLNRPEGFTSTPREGAVVLRFARPVRG